MKYLNDYLNEGALITESINAKEVGITKPILTKINKALKKQDYTRKGMSVRREFFINKAGILICRVNAIGRRTTPRDLFRLAIHNGFSANTKYVELDNAPSYVADDKGTLHRVSDASAKRKGSITDIYGDDIDTYSEYEVEIEYYEVPTEVFTDNLDK